MPPLFLYHHHPALFPRSLIAKQNFSHAFPVICDGSPSRILSVLRISFGITTLPSSSILRTMPVARNTSSLLESAVKFSRFVYASLVWNFAP